MPSSKFGPLPTQNQWESEVGACYNSFPDDMKQSHHHLFVRESVAIRNLRINAVICGFEKTRELFKLKLEETFVEDQFYDGFVPNYEPSSDNESNVPPDGMRRRTKAEELTLRTNFLTYNTTFWLSVFKYHPVFYHHQCVDWPNHNNSTMISMCPMAHTCLRWREENGLKFLDSSLLANGDACSIVAAKPHICHKQKLNVKITCSRLEHHLRQLSGDCVFHGGLLAMTEYCKANFGPFVTWQSKKPAVESIHNKMLASETVYSPNYV